MYVQLAIIILRCGIRIVFPKSIIKEYNPSMHNCNVATVDCSYMFQSLQSTHCQVASKHIQHKARILQPDDGYSGVTKTCSCSLQLQY